MVPGGDAGSAQPVMRAHARRSAAIAAGPDERMRPAEHLRTGRRMKVKGVWTSWSLLGRVGLGVGDDELKRRVWDCGPAALLAALTA